MYVCICICIYAYAYTHTHTHIYIYIYIYITALLEPSALNGRVVFLRRLGSAYTFNGDTKSTNFPIALGTEKLPTCRIKLNADMVCVTKASFVLNSASMSDTGPEHLRASPKLMQVV